MMHVLFCQIPKSDILFLWISSEVLSYDYCCTCHNYQGSSIDGKVTIFDYKHYFMSRKWIWTSVTRATNLDDVYFFDYTNDPLHARTIKDYFKKKCDGYKGQDKADNRSIPSEGYVTANWFMEKMKAGQCCQERGCGLYVSSSGTTSNITAQRLDNQVSHTIDNCIIMCTRCNVTAK